MAQASFVLVPGFWLGGWAWDAVAAELQHAGHSVVTVTLPGLDPADTDRGNVSWADQVDALARIVAEAEPHPVLVVHSGAGPVASGVVDRDPEAVSQVIYVDSGPSGHRPEPDPDVPVDLDELPLPSWSELEQGGNSLAGLSQEQLANFAARAVPEPAGVPRGPVVLTNEARRAVPCTVVCCSMPSAQIRQLIADGHPWVAELAAMSAVSYVDLPTGHWPMWSKPAELAAVLLDAASAG